MIFMIILGIDPGLATVGYGVIKSENGNVTPIDYGVILTPKEAHFFDRLYMIEKSTEKLLLKYNPDEVAMEELFFNNNAKTAIDVAQARGVTLVTCMKHTRKLFEYTPLQIKQALTGYGRADKKQIQEMVKRLLNLKKIPKPDDAADALAVALTHSNTSRFSSGFGIK